MLKKLFFIFLTVFPLVVGVMCLVTLAGGISISNWQYGVHTLAASLSQYEQDIHNRINPERQAAVQFLYPPPGWDTPTPTTTSEPYPPPGRDTPTPTATATLTQTATSTTTSTQTLTPTDEIPSPTGTATSTATAVATITSTVTTTPTRSSTPTLTETRTSTSTTTATQTTTSTYEPTLTSTTTQTTDPYPAATNIPNPPRTKPGGTGNFHIILFIGAAAVFLLSGAAIILFLLYQGVVKPGGRLRNLF